MSVSKCDVDGEAVDEGRLGSAEHDELEFSRRRFLQSASVVGATLSTGLGSVASAETTEQIRAAQAVTQPLTLSINKKTYNLVLDTRTSLLDTLREHLGLTGSKKGCDHGQCGACTVLVNGRRVNSCLLLAASVAGDDITTIEGLGTEDQLSEMQKQFLTNDAFQCGYCTPGQICSATALMEEFRHGEASVVSFEDGTQNTPKITDHEIRERMSGNLCRCGAYPNIVQAVRSAARQGGQLA